MNNLVFSGLEEVAAYELTTGVYGPMDYDMEAGGVIRNIRAGNKKMRREECLGNCYG
jgi:hypothetical protein